MSSETQSSTAAGGLLHADTAGLTAAQKVLAVLGAVGDSVVPMRLHEVAESAGLPKSTVHRVLGMLVEEGLVARVGNLYQLGDRLLSWLEPSWVHDDRLLRATLMPYLLDLYHLTHSAVVLAVLGDRGVRYVASIFDHDAFPSPSRRREWAPAQCTAVGKVLLSGLAAREGAAAVRPFLGDPAAEPAPDLSAELATVGRTGIGYSLGQYVPGLSCVAVPIAGSTAAVGIGDYAERFDVARSLRSLRRIAVSSSAALQRVSHAGRLREQ